MSIKVDVKQIGDVSLVSISGRITLGEGSETLRDSIKDLVSTGHIKIILGTKDVSFIDSSGVGELVTAYTTVSNNRGKLVLLSPSERICNMLNKTKLYTIFEVYSSLEEALEHF